MEIIKKIEEILSDLMDEQQSVSTNTLIKQFDSLTIMELIVLLEDFYNIKFTISELAKLKTIGEIVEIINDKKN